MTASHGILPLTIVVLVLLSSDIQNVRALVREEADVTTDYNHYTCTKVIGRRCTIRTWRDSCHKKLSGVGNCLADGECRCSYYYNTPPSFMTKSDETLH
uniref:Uncharacterized protein n=1 Tax=Aegilops tauschii TaxID=37682 RepID=N1QRN8_AEGTA